MPPFLEIGFNPSYELESVDIGMTEWAGVPKLQAFKGRVLAMQGCVGKYRSPTDEDDFSTTPAGLDLA